LQGVMFAVRFASIRLTTQITGARVNAADQFAFSINATSGGATLSSGASSGTGLGPFTAAALSSTSALPLTLNQAMAAGSANTISHYLSSLTCTNAVTGTGTPMPTAAITTSYSFGAMQFGDNVQCTYTMTPYPHLTLRKLLGAGGRQYATDQVTVKIDAGATTVASATTTGTGSTVLTGVTPQYQATAGTTYRLYETASAGTSLNQYTAAMACSNAWSGSPTTLVSGSGWTITPQMGDVITCSLTNTKIAANALLTILKSSTVVSDPVNGATNPKYIPGAIVQYTFTVANTGPSAVDSNSLWLIDTLPATLGVGTAANPVFSQGSPTSGLSFTAGTDLKYSNAATAPSSFAGCTYTPTSSYDPAVRFVCLNPKGTMAASTGTPPSFTLSIQARVN
ncbi:MAG: hypothetical protein KGN34_10945, partial [Sphingomonadales bacterium]|nr:hypothetical protein [Sphingomonadales bacterium]